MSYQSTCYKCGSLSRGGLCGMCMTDERQVAENVQATLSVQEQMLHEQRKMAEEQRIFNQKILEQAITLEEAFENAKSSIFEDGDIRFGEDGFEFTFPSPYQTDKLTKAFFEGVESNFHNHFPNIDMDEVSSQLTEIGSDFKNHLIQKFNELIANPPPKVGTASRQAYAGTNPSTGRPWTNAELLAKWDDIPGPDGSMSKNEIRRMIALDTSIDTPGYERRSYRIIRKSAIDGNSYCLHLFVIKFKIGLSNEGEVFVDGIDSALIKNPTLWGIFNNALDLQNTLIQFNNSDQVKVVKGVRNNSNTNATKKVNTSNQIFKYLLLLVVLILIYENFDYIQYRFF